MADHIRSLLEGMGGTAEEVRDFLAAQGVRGDKGIFSCPVALYLDRATGLKACGVSPSKAYACSLEVDLPTPVAEFVYRFDHGYFPELEA